MALQQGYYQSQSQRPQATAHLAQTMSLLGLNSQELNQEIEAALSKNPALELVEGRHCPGCGRSLRPAAYCPTCNTAKGLDDEPLVFVAPSESSYASGSGQGLSEDIPNADTEDLPSYVLRQIAPDLEPDELEIAARLLTSLNEDGLLTADLQGEARYSRVPVTTVEAITDLIRHADPVGVGALNPTQALLTQLEVLADKAPDAELCARTIEEGMAFLSKRHYGELAQLLGTSKKVAEEIAEFITSNLNPYPARAHWGNQRIATNEAPPTYQRPDLIIREQQGSESGRLVVEVTWPLRGLLRVNPLFQEALKEAPEDKAEQWKIDLEQASLLIKCLAQRNHTIVRLMQILAVVQREYILAGNAHIKPLTRSSLADELGVHESTISRAVSGKSVQLPNNKIVPLSQFFDRSLHIRTALKEIIREEPEEKPLSDTKLARLLAKEGYEIARRTVAKYRNMEGILPAHLRKATAN
jgi:RNA polymerase sigma-54 factor